MLSPWKSRLLLAGLTLVGAAVFCAGITWGLPTRKIDPYLFGPQAVWPGARILELAGGWQADRAVGADVDVDPLQKAVPVRLNETDAQRAAILTRYRLYTYQPDEMITMRALAGMHPRELQFDPKLYQYGGLWIYPVGTLLKLASLAGAIRLTPDVAWYLDHPEDFGRFYVVARLYAASWALVGLWAVWWLARRLTGSVAAAATAAACYIAMPVVINMAHEAKPHLPAAVLMLLAIIAATRYVDTGKARWWLATAVLCGAAFGMVLSALPIFVLIPLMLLLRRQSWRERLGRMLAGFAVASAVYAATNPYVLINAVNNRAVLQSNLGNSVAMYEIGRWREGLADAAWLVAEGTSIVLAVLGAIATLAFAFGALKSPQRKRVQPVANTASQAEPACGDTCGRRSAAVLLAAPVVLILLQFIALAADKPGEYGRFAVLPDVTLGIAAVAFAWRGLQRRDHRTFGLVMLIAFTAVQGYPYLHAFLRDSGPDDSRVLAAARLEQLRDRGAGRLAVIAEPAPYVMPPFDLFHWDVVLIPASRDAAGRQLDALINVDVAHASAAEVAARSGLLHLGSEIYPEHVISWAGRAFEWWIPARPSSEPASRAAQ